MAKKPTLTRVTSGTVSPTVLNNNSEAIEEAFENTVSRDGSTPNTMEADFDMNSNDILNAGTVNTQYLKINGQLAGDASTAFNWRGDFDSNATYAYLDVFKDSGNTYVCLVDFDAGGLNLAFQIAIGRVELFTAKGDNGAGSGDLLAANNLSDLASVSSALSNLGLTVTASEINNFVTPVDDDTELKSLDVTNGRYLYNVDREAFFEFDSSNLNTEVNNDTSESIYVAPTSDATGASGAYIMQFTDQKVHARNLGMKSFQDCTDQMNKAIEYINSGDLHEVEFGNGVYRFGDTLDRITSGNFTIKGSNNGASVLSLDSTTGSHQGRMFLIGNDSGASVVARSKFQDLAFRSESGDEALRLFANAWVSDFTMRDCRFENSLAGILGVTGENPSARYFLENLTGGYDATKNVVAWDFASSASLINFDHVIVFGQGGETTAATLRVAPPANTTTPSSPHTVDVIRYHNSAGYGSSGQDNTMVFDLTNGSITNVWIQDSALDNARKSNIKIVDAGTGTRWMRQFWITRTFLQMRSDADANCRNIQANFNGTDTRIDSFQVSQSSFGFRGDGAVQFTDGGNGSIMQGANINNCTFGHSNTNASLTPVDAVVETQFPITLVNNTVTERRHGDVVRVDHLLNTPTDVQRTKVIGNDDSECLDQTVAPYGSETAANRGTWEVFGNSNDHLEGKEWRERKETHSTDAGFITDWRTSIVEATMTLTADRSVQLTNDGARPGQEMVVLCKATMGGFSYQVRDRDSTTVIHTFTTTDEWARFRYTGTTWEKIAAGSL